jgi:periodic tryptophan protein 2
LEIDGKRDIAGGRKVNDRMTSDNNAASRYFTSVCYSADGLCILAGGNSKYICIYEVSQQILVKKFQISFNRSLDGILDELNSRKLADGGPIDVNDSGDDADFSANLPGSKRGDDGSRKSKVEVITMQVAFSSTGREWAAVSNEGLHVYSLDDDMIFDPIALTEEITPGSVQSNLRSGNHSVALLISLHLNEFALVRQVLEETPFASIPHVVKSINHEHLERLMQYIAKCMSDSPHLEFYMQWSIEMLKIHGIFLEKHRSTYMRAFRAMHRTVQTHHNELKRICDENRYTLDYVEDQVAININR